MIIFLIVFIDFIVAYFTFIYQRGTLLLARQDAPEATTKDLAEIQIQYTPTWICAVSWLNWITLIFAVFLLWGIQWWYPVIYLLVRLVGIALLPSFEKQTSRAILERGPR